MYVNGGLAGSTDVVISLLENWAASGFAESGRDGGRTTGSIGGWAATCDDEGYEAARSCAGLGRGPEGVGGGRVGGLRGTEVADDP